MATKIEIYTDEVYPVYFVDVIGLTDEAATTTVEETELTDILAVQENFWKLQKKLRDMYQEASNED